MDSPAREYEVNETRLRAMIQYSWEVVALLTVEGRIQYISPATSWVLGYPSHELAGRTVFELMHPEDRAAMAQLFSQVIVETSRRLLNTQAAALYRLEPVSGDLVMVARGGDMRLEGLVLRRGIGAVGLAVATRQPVVSANVLTDGPGPRR